MGSAAPDAERAHRHGRRDHQVAHAADKVRRHRGGEISDRDAAAVNKALELLGKTPELALFVDRHEHGGVNAFDAMSVDELRRYVAEEVKALGIHVPSTNRSGNRKH